MRTGDNAPLCLFWNSPSGESDAEAIIVRLNLHGRLDLSGTSAPTSWLSVRFASGDAASRSFPFLTRSRLVLLSDAELHSEICVCCVSHGPQRGLCADDSARNHSNFMRRAWFVCLGCVRLEMEARFAYCGASSTAGLRFCVEKKKQVCCFPWALCETRRLVVTSRGRCQHHVWALQEKGIISCIYLEMQENSWNAQ